MSSELSTAASEGDLEKVKKLYKKEDEIFSAMSMAAFKGHLEVLKYLVYQGEESTLEVKYKGRSVLDYKRGLGQSLFYASQENHMDLVDFLISKDAHKEDPFNTRTAMHAAATNGNNEIIVKLLDAGMDVDIPDEDGCTPLSEAVGSKQVETVKLLISKAADPFKDDDHGESSWDMAVDGGNTEIKKIINDSFPESRRIPGL